MTSPFAWLAAPAPPPADVEAYQLLVEASGLLHVAVDHPEQAQAAKARALELTDQASRIAQDPFYLQEAGLIRDQASGAGSGCGCGTLGAVGDQVGTIVAAPNIGRLSPYALFLLYKLKDQGINPDFVAAIMSIESGFKPTAKNPSTNASGLIQVLPNYVKQYGYSSYKALLADSAANQIKKIVAKWRWPKSSNDVGDYYLSLFLPIAISWPDDRVIARKGDPGPAWPNGASLDKMWQQNYGFDRNKDGVFTVGDVRQFARDRLAVSKTRPRVPVIETAPPADPLVSALNVGWALVIAGGAWLAYRRFS